MPSDQAQGAQVPGFQRFWLLAAMGGCPVRTKAAAAAAVGAEGVCVGGVKVKLTNETDWFVTFRA